MRLPTGRSSALCPLDCEAERPRFSRCSVGLTWSAYWTELPRFRAGLLSSTCFITVSRGAGGFRLLALSRTSEGCLRLLALSRTSAFRAVSLECPSEARSAQHVPCQVFSGASVDRCRCETGSPTKWLRSLSLRGSLLARLQCRASREECNSIVHAAAVLNHVASSP